MVRSNWTRRGAKLRMDIGTCDTCTFKIIEACLSKIHHILEKGKCYWIPVIKFSLVTTCVKQALERQVSFQHKVASMVL
jgi:hypothetical protein